MKGLSHYFSDPLNFILSILFILSLTGAWQYAKKTPGLDYYVAWAAADAIKNDTPVNIYKSSSRYKLAVLYHNKAVEKKDNPRQKAIAKYRKTLPMTATPFMYWVTGLLVTGDYETDLSVWHLLSITFLTVSILLICRLLGYSMATTLVLLIPVLIMFAPLQADLRVGNVNSFQMGVIGLILWMQKFGSSQRILFITGFLISLLAMFKPNLAPIAILFAGGWVIRGQYSRFMVTLSGMVSGGILAVLVSSLWMGRATVWLDWFKFLREAVKGVPGSDIGNYSVMTEISGGLSPPGQLTLGLLFCALCLLVLWLGRRIQKSTAPETSDDDRVMLENTLLIASGCIVALLSSSLVWAHYYVLTLPMILVVLRPSRSPELMKPLNILMLRILPVIAMFGLLETDIAVVLAGMIKSKDYWVMATSGAAIILFICGLWQLACGTRDQRETT